MTRPTQQALPRLVADDFVALRSLMRGSWVQGERIAWRFQKDWASVTYSDVPALDASDRLIAMGLAEEVECPCGTCRRLTIRLTARGTAFVERMNKTPEPVAYPAPTPNEPPPARHSWLARLLDVLGTRSSIERAHSPSRALYKA